MTGNEVKAVQDSRKVPKLEFDLKSQRELLRNTGLNKKKKTKLRKRGCTPNEKHSIMLGTMFKRALTWLSFVSIEMK